MQEKLEEDFFFLFVSGSSVGLFTQGLRVEHCFYEVACQILQLLIMLFIPCGNEKRIFAIFKLPYKRH